MWTNIFIYYNYLYIYIHIFVITQRRAMNCVLFGVEFSECEIIFLDARMNCWILRFTNNNRWFPSSKSGEVDAVLLSPPWADQVQGPAEMWPFQKVFRCHVYAKHQSWVSTTKFPALNHQSCFPAEFPNHRFNIQSAQGIVEHGFSVRRLGQARSSNVTGRAKHCRHVRIQWCCRSQMSKP